jgi:hypothetical protein
MYNVVRTVSLWSLLLFFPVYLIVCFAGQRHVIQAGLGILPELRTAG